MNIKRLFFISMTLVMISIGCAKQPLHTFVNRVPAQENNTLQDKRKLAKGDHVRLKDGTTQFIESVSNDGKVNFRPSDDPFDHIKLPTNYPADKLVLAVEEKNGIKVGQTFPLEWTLEPVGKIAFIFEDGQISFETENKKTGLRTLKSAYIDEFKLSPQGELIYKQANDAQECLRILKNIL